MTYDNLGQIVIEMSDTLNPPERLTVAQSAEKYRRLNNPGAYVGPWLNSKVPYLVEPMECMTDRSIKSVIFAGPAQGGKTDMLLNFIAHTIKCDPMDMILYEKSQAAARDFSRRRLGRLFRHSPEIGKLMLDSGDADNVFDKTFKSGMMLTLSWPSINELSGKPVGRVMLTDYDRMDDDIDGEGSAFDLARKRTTTFRSAGKTVAESSPGKEVTDPKWVKTSPHEAPPCQGILALYNRGDRRRWLWKCIHCGNWFEPSFALLRWPLSADPMEAGEAATLQCPHCRKHIKSEHKYEMNLHAMAFGWLKDGQRRTKDDKTEGVARRSDIASFWHKGPAAAFATWSDLVSRFILAEQEYEKTGADETLKTTINTDQAEAYVPRRTESERLPEDLKETNERLIGDRVVPERVRFLIVAIDVQKNRFVAQTFGIAPATVGFDVYVIDREEVVKSKRYDDDGERLWVKPHQYVEDWFLLMDIATRRYPLCDGSGTMGIKLCTVDSGGKEGVTMNAYDFWRELRDDAEGLYGDTYKRFWLGKGDNNKRAPTTRVSYPESATKARAGARGEIPVLMYNPTNLKNKLDGMLGTKDAPVNEGQGGIFFADWLPFDIYKEMTAETKNLKGEWERIGKTPNEAFDLAAYCLGNCHYLRVGYIDWSKPPSWAAPWESNTLVKIDKKPTGGGQGVAKPADPDYDVAKLGELLG